MAILVAGHPKFAYFAPMDGHEASLLRIRTIDRSLEKFISDIKAREDAEGGELAVVFCGDHGVWYGKYYEESLMGPSPFFSPPRVNCSSYAFTPYLLPSPRKWPTRSFIIKASS